MTCLNTFHIELIRLVSDDMFNTFHIEFIRLVSDDMFKYIPYRIYQVSK